MPVIPERGQAGTWHTFTEGMDGAMGGSCRTLQSKAVLAVKTRAPAILSSQIKGTLAKSTFSAWTYEGGPAETLMEA